MSSLFEEKEQSAEKKAFDKALRFLSFRSRSTAEVRRYLRKHGFETSLIDKIIERLQNLDYLNDSTFAAHWITERVKLKHLGRRRLYEELLKKGLDRDLIEEQLNKFYNSAEEFKHAYSLAQKRAKQLRKFEPEVAQRRLGQYLLRQGYPSEIAWSLAQKLIKKK